MADELTMQLRSILDTGDRLVHYDAENSPVVAEIIKAYSGFVRDYLEGAADFAKKYRRAKAFIKTKDPNSLALEVRTLEKRIADGEKGLEKMLAEKKSTLHRLEGMVGNQPVIRNGIETIQATLESLDASIAEAEADPGTAEGNHGSNSAHSVLYGNGHREDTGGGEQQRPDDQTGLKRLESMEVLNNGTANATCRKQSIDSCPAFHRPVGKGQRHVGR